MNSQRKLVGIIIIVSVARSLDGGVVGVDERWVPSVRPPSLSTPHLRLRGHIEGSQSVCLAFCTQYNQSLI